MCRWNAYFGQPVAVDELLFKTAHGLIDQSLRSRMGVETPNGDGFGLGWYGLEIPESTALIIQPGADEQRPFQPQGP
jgi:predicted glutamine amidotransferase